MQKFYFTYGSSSKFPYQDGWTEVIAKNKKDAIELFHRVHPRTNGWINCAFLYSEEDFMKTEMYLLGSFGVYAHEIITEGGVTKT